MLLAVAAGATDFPLPPDGDDVVGEIYFVEVRDGETLVDIARAHDIGQEQLRRANLAIDRWLPAPGTPVLIPSRYVLPDAPHEGLVLNLPEMRLYHFPPQSGDAVPRIHTYPVSIGRADWATPLGETAVVAKQRDPPWYPPESLKAEAAAEGRSLPDVVPPGPDNPLGGFALRLGIPGYLIHGTNRPFGVGMRVTHGCIRMLPEDIARLFERVAVGTPVRIVDQPVKAGWLDGVLHVEVHPPLEEDTTRQADLFRHTLELVYARLTERPAVLDAAALRDAVDARHGIPVAVSQAGAVGMPLGNPLFD
jgi:L,D-transpeptidase ErfK/SrfK